MSVPTREQFLSEFGVVVVGVDPAMPKDSIVLLTQELSPVMVWTMNPDYGSKPTYTISFYNDGDSRRQQHVTHHSYGCYSTALREYLQENDPKGNRALVRREGSDDIRVFAVEIKPSEVVFVATEDSYPHHTIPHSYDVVLLGPDGNQDKVTVSAHSAQDAASKAYGGGPFGARRVVVSFDNGWAVSVFDVQKTPREVTVTDA